MPTGSLDMLNDPGLQRMLADGSAVDTGQKAAPVPAVKRDKRKPVLLPNVFHSQGGTLCFIIGLVTASESNGRVWQQRSKRTQAARLAVSKVFGPNLAALAGIAEWYHKGRPIRVVFTRLGGGRLDKGNLPPAMKAVEDAVCLILGCDDGDDRWLAEFEQEPRVGDGLGVRIELSRAS